MGKKMWYLLLLLPCFCIFSDAQKRVSLDLELRESSGETYKLQDVLEVDSKILMIVYKEASCNTCVDKAHQVTQNVVNLLMETADVYMLSNYNSVRTQKILETRLNLQNVIYYCKKSDILAINATNAPIIMLIDSAGIVLKIEIIDERETKDIMEKIFDWFN